MGQNLGNVNEWEHLKKIDTFAQMGQAIKGFKWQAKVYLDGIVRQNQMIQGFNRLWLLSPVTLGDGLTSLSLICVNVLSEDNI